MDLHVVIGLGSSGLSTVRHLVKQGIPVAVNDTRANPPNLQTFKETFPDVPVSLGKLDEALLEKAAKIIVSPGLSVHEAPIAKQAARGVPVIGDIELFAAAAKAPVIAITGTNAKSTVTTLVGKMAENAGVKVQVGGNLGVPALDLLVPAAPELFVLELSSFQLETTYSLKPQVATVLNVTPDHMDRYATLQDYCNAKQRVYLGTHAAVCNRDDPYTDCNGPIDRKIYFTLNQPQESEFGLTKNNNETCLALGSEILLAARELPILGRHYQANALAALAIGHSYGLSMDAMLATLRQFKGLPHRCELVLTQKEVQWYNDSKGTNVGATLAAILGLGSEIQGKLILIAGGVGKNADFSALVPALEKYARTVVLIGEAAPILADTIGNRVPVRHAGSSMEDAVAIAETLALPGDSVLLSPACASFDMFKNFEHRGKVFTEIVQSLR